MSTPALAIDIPARVYAARSRQTASSPTPCPSPDLLEYRLRLLRPIATLHPSPIYHRLEFTLPQTPSSSASPSLSYFAMATGADKGANRSCAQNNININNASPELRRYELEQVNNSIATCAEHLQTRDRTPTNQAASTQEVSDLRVSHAELEYSLASTKCLLVEQKDDNRQLAIEHIILETDLDDQSRKLAVEMTRSAESKKEETRLRRRVTELETDTKSKDTSASALEQQISEKDANIASLEEKIEQLQNKLNAATEEAKEAKNEAKGLKKDLTSAQKEATMEGKASDNLKKEVEDLKQRLEEKSSEVKSLKKDLTAAKKETTSENKAGESLKKELQRLQETLDEKTSELEDLKAEKDTVSKELQSTKSQLNSKKKKADDESASKISELEQTIKDLKAELKEVNKANKALTVELESSNNEADAVTALTKEKLSLARQLTTVQAENDALKATTEDHRQILTEKLQLSHQVEQLQVELENEKKAVKHASKSKSDVDNVKKTYEKQLADLKDQLNKQTKLAERAAKDLEKDRDSWDTQRAALEKKLENWKSKAKANAAAPAPKGKKRGATAFDDDAESPPKKAKKSTVAKSTFSTTPFLARHISVAPSEAESTPSKPSASEIETTVADSPAPFLPGQVTEMTETETEADDVSLPAPAIKTETIQDLMPPPPKPAPKAAKAKAAPAQKIFLSTTALKHSKSRSSSLAPETSLLGDDELEYMPKTGKAGKKGNINKENVLPDTITEDPEEGGSPAITTAKEPKPKKTRIRKLIGNTLGNTLFDDDGEDGTFNKFRAPSVTGFNKDFSPLKARGTAYEGVRSKLVIKKAAKGGLA
ncbi:LOW QUALITY PROTEIN: hypothetical protein Dda_4820 [Drechslerella dactyloides]|uniref:Uncharacterized protein n=1 Tax=Drechslerella dactyloides TaxID=74499 RepID=A0AAD6IXM2_DREDA|nr:LOW QUALITY PROTEIN: hypothetical protein Dda_4820 [Drechslerella dactyloides]